MAKPQRGLPADFSLNLPDDVPVALGDFLDEPAPPIPRRIRAEEVKEFRQQLPVETVSRQPQPVRPVREKARSPRAVRFQLNLSPHSKAEFEDLVGHIQNFSPEFDTRHSEVFQAIIALLHDCKDELDLAALPRRGAWGSISARNFVGALSTTLEQGIIRAAKKRGIG